MFSIIFPHFCSSFTGNEELSNSVATSAPEAGSAGKNNSCVADFGTDSGESVSLFVCFFYLGEEEREEYREDTSAAEEEGEDEDKQGVLDSSAVMTLLETCWRYLFITRYCPRGARPPAR